MSIIGDLSPAKASEPNEARADIAEVLLREGSDNIRHDGYTAITEGFLMDASDVIADFRHLADRYGVQWGELLERVERTYEGDVAEEGGRVRQR